jgi:hypothetical protein
MGSRFDDWVNWHILLNYVSSTNLYEESLTVV